MEKSYGKNEIDLMLKPISDHLSKQDEVLVAIKDQTTRTNGRVSALEFWKSIVLWALGGIYVVITMIFFIYWHFMKIEVTQDSAVAAKQAVDDALSQYNIEVRP